ncbi:MAG: PAS domain S-box protein, partial [Dehalococcoidales bacterium]|nr:PAS domain S-box protein [Dehalococcoidales bacterium]
MREGNAKAKEALRLSEERFRTMFEGHQAIMLLIEPESGRIVDANPAAAEFYGYPRDELRRMSIQDINQLPTEQVKEQRSRAVNKDQIKFIFPHRLANGEVRTVEVHSTPISFDKRTLLFSIIHDITERMEAEQKLAALSERRRHLLNLSRVIVGERNMSQLLTKVAGAALDLTRSRIAVCGHGSVNGSFTVGGAHWIEGASPCPPEESFHIEKGGVLLELIQGKDSIRLTQTQLVEHPAWWGLPENHAPLNGLLGARLIDENGQSNGVIMVSDKITGEFTEEDEFFLRRLAIMTSLALQHIKARQEVEQKAAELESRVQSRTAELQQAYNVIRQNQTLLQDLFENIGEGVVLIDIQGKVLKINKAAGEILGIDQSVVEGTFYDSPHWRGKITLPKGMMLSRENLGAFLQTSLQQVRRNLEVQVQLDDGNRRWLRGSIAPLVGSSPQIEGIIVTFADITAEKEFQREREQFSSRLLETQEQERKRIAYELHDDTAQYLSILKMQLGALVDSGEIQSPEIKEKLKFLEKDADRAFNDVRR